MRTTRTGEYMASPDLTATADTRSTGPRVRTLPRLEDALCQELCAISGADRSVLFLGSDPRAVRSAGSFGVGDAGFEQIAPGRTPASTGAPRSYLEEIYAALSSSARQAARAGRVVIVPLEIDGRPLGFFLAQGAEPRREPTASFARTAALGLRSTSPLAVARQLHDTVAQRLAGLSYLLAGNGPLAPAERQCCRKEIAASLSDVRAVIEGVLDGEPAHSSTVAGELAALCREHPDVRFESALEDAAFGDGLDSLIETFVAEGLRNAREHAQPSRVVVSVESEAETVSITVRNDRSGARHGGGCGMGLRLLQTQAMLAGGVVEVGPDAEEGWWRARLIVPSTG